MSFECINYQIQDIRQMDDEDIKRLSQSKQKIDLHISIIETFPKQSANYSLYISQMSQFMKLSFQKIYIGDERSYSYQSLFSLIFVKKNPTLKFRQGDSFVEVTLAKINQSKDSILINIQYNKQVIYKCSVFIRDELSPFHQRCASSSGNFANVYKAKLDGHRIAVKCFLINEEKSIFSQFMKLLKYQYLGVGPSLTSIKQYNIIIYRNCMEFVMECCDQVSKYSPQMEKDLRLALVKLHSSNIIHFDIKPQNICFSPTINKYVFIDFGLSEIIPEKLGQTKVLSFRGSLGYCSDQMKACSRLPFCEVDPYYNDLHCLNQSIKVLKQSNVENYCEQNQLLQMNYYFRNLEYQRKFFVFFNSNEIHRKSIFQSIRNSQSYEQCQQLIQTLQKGEYDYEVNLAFQKSTQKYRILNKSQPLGISSHDFNHYDNRNTMAVQQISNIYSKIFQNQQNHLDQTTTQDIILSTNIQTISDRKEEKIQFIKLFLQKNKVQHEHLNTQQCFKKYYSLILKYIDHHPNERILYLMKLAHFLPSFILFNTIEFDELGGFFQTYLFNLQQSAGKLRSQKIWITIIFKFMMSFEWFEVISIQIYRYNQLQEQIFSHLHKFIERMPLAFFEEQSASLHHVLLKLASQIKKSSTNYQHKLVLAKLQELGFKDNIQRQLRQIFQYLYCMIARKLPYSFRLKEIFGRKFNSFIYQNQQYHNYKLYPYYFNVFNCIYLLKQKKLKWISERIRNSFSQFSFFKQILLFYFDKQTIFNFPLLYDSVQHNLLFFSPEQSKIFYMYGLIKMFLINKYCIFLNKQRELNSYIFSLGECNNIIQCFKSKINSYSQKYPHYLICSCFILQITAFFRYLTVLIFHQFGFNSQNYKVQVLEYKKISSSQKNPIKQKKPSQESSIKMETHISDQPPRNISQFITIWKTIKSPACLNCKIRYEVYAKLLDCLQLLFSMQQRQSFDEFISLVILCKREDELAQFVNEALSIYFHTYFCRSVNIQLSAYRIFMNITLQIAFQNSHSLLHIILNTPQLYYHLFKRIAIQFPLAIIKTLIVPTLQELAKTNNFQINEQIQTVFKMMWRRLEAEIPQYLFSFIWKIHIFNELRSYVQRILRLRDSIKFQLVRYVLAIMHVFRLYREHQANLYKFISVAVQYQPKQLKQYYIGRFYQVFWKQNRSKRFQVFKSKKNIKFTLLLRKFDQCQLISSIKIKMRKGYANQKNCYGVIYKKLLKYTANNQVN